VRVHELSKELGINIKELMGYLNQLGANVRNHMSTIEDKFVDQARHDFPAIPKKSRLTGVTAPASARRPVPPGVVSSKPTSSATEDGGPTVGGVQPPFKAHVPVALTTKPVVAPNQSQSKRPGTATRQPQAAGPAATSQEAIRPAPASNRPQPNRPVTAAAQQAPVRPAPPRRPDAANRTRGTQQSLPAQQAGGARQKADVPRAAGTRPAPDDRRREFSRNNNQTPDNQRSKAPLPKTKSPQRGPQVNGPGPDRKQSGDRPPFKSQQFKGNRPQSGGGLRGNGNDSRPNRSQSGYNNKRGFGRGRAGQTTSHPMPQKPRGPATNVKSVQLPTAMTVKDFAQLVELAAGEIIKKLMGLGVMATINQEIDRDTMTLIAAEFGIKAEAALTEEEKVQVEEIKDDPATLVKRSPVVTIMGHVDHGKTSLLDAIRETNVIAQEAGGITQHIGAYQVELKDRKITFLDTPGHAAFTAMRARGAQVTDIAVLVVAADDGVMPQTIEAINHAKDANVSMIIAVNKIDKPDANPDRVKQDLTEYGLVAEEWGGDTIFVPVSAKQRIGIENLLEMILLVADLKELKANPNRSAKGTIIEAELDKGRGPVATVLVQNGTLGMGDSIIAGAAFGKVRALINDKGKRVKKAGPSTPVAVIGFDELPEAGDIMYAITDERLARQLADRRMQLKRETELSQTQKVTLNDLFSKIKEGAIKELKLIIKADVQGSVEAIRQSLERLSTEVVKVKVIHGGVGAINEGDVTFAAAANAIVIGFNVRPDPSAKRMAEKENVDIQLYRVIYNIIEDVQKAMEGMLDPEYKEVIVGRAEVRAVYKVPKVGNIGGCYISEGKISRNHEIRLLRDNIVIHEGKIDSLKRFKDDVREVAEGFECGMGIVGFNDIKEGDVIEAFTMEEIKR
jgi:translation initiation factor IF-2